jgi:hypothetical protein
MADISLFAAASQRSVSENQDMDKTSYHRHTFERQCTIWCRWFLQDLDCACALALVSAGSSIAASIAMIAMTTSSSIRVKPFDFSPVDALLLLRCKPLFPQRNSSPPLATLSAIGFRKHYPLQAEKSKCFGLFSPGQRGLGEIDPRGGCGCWCAREGLCRCQ